MRRRVSWLAVSTVTVALGMACGGSSSSPNNPSGTGSTNSFTLTVGAMTSALNSNTITATPGSTPGSLVIAGSSTTGTTSLSVTVNLGFLNGPGTYPLGINPATTPGGSLGLQASVSGALSNWLTPFSGNAGSITITTLTATQIAGTLQANVPPVAPTTGIQSISTASFSVTMSGFVPATAANPGNTMTATLNGGAFVGGTVVGSASGGGFTISGTATNAAGVATSVTLASGELAVGSFPFFSATGPAVTVTFVAGKNTAGGTSSDIGTVTISGVSGGRVTGTFSGTLSPGVTIANGAFAVRIQ